MKQIKTIAEAKIPEFDKGVNAAIADGWQLVKRDCFIVSEGHIPMLYAELEKDVITWPERCCENCKFCEISTKDEPCLSCSDDADKWEAAE